MRQKSRVFSFSAIDEDLIWLEGFKERLGSKSFSKAIITALKESDKCEDILKTCKALDIDANAILAYHISIHRPISKDPTSDQSLDFFEKLELNRNA